MSVSVAEKNQPKLWQRLGNFRACHLSMVLMFKHAINPASQTCSTYIHRRKEAVFQMLRIPQALLYILHSLKHVSPKQYTHIQSAIKHHQIVFLAHSCQSPSKHVDSVYFSSIFNPSPIYFPVIKHGQMFPYKIFIYYSIYIWGPHRHVCWFLKPMNSSSLFAYQKP